MDQFLSASCRYPGIDVLAFSDGDIRIAVVGWGVTEGDRSVIRRLAAGEPVPATTRVRVRLRRTYRYSNGASVRLAQSMHSCGEFDVCGLANALAEWCDIDGNFGEGFPAWAQALVGQSGSLFRSVVIYGDYDRIDAEGLRLPDDESTYSREYREALNICFRR